MDFGILGPLEVVGGTGPVVLPRGRGRALLAVLILRAGEVISADRLVDDLWGPAPPPTATKGLHNLVSDLRRRLGLGWGGDHGAASVLVTSGPGYALRIDPDRVDAHRFRQLLDEASDAPATVRADRLRTALALWRGPALMDFAYEPFAQADISFLTELRLVALEERIEADLTLGRHAELVGEVEGLVAEHPFRERLRAQLMLALYRCGRQADALAVYQAGRRRLVEELGLEPGPALVDIERRILTQDPALQLAPRGGDTMRAVTGEPRIEAGAWLAGERKTITVAYVELAESTPAPGAADPELVQRRLARAVETATGILERHGGSVEGFLGGVIVVVFGVPIAHEDDALRAARATLELSEAVAALDLAGCEPEPRTRMAVRAGINTGEVVVGDPSVGGAAASGDAVKLAARLQQKASAGEVLLGDTSRQLLGSAAKVESANTLILDGRGRPAAAWRLLDVSPDAPGGAPGSDQPLIGRARELTRLHAAFQRVMRERHARRFTVLGEPGIGKSRLAEAFAEALSPGRVLVGRCLAYGEGITFWPVREIVLQASEAHGVDITGLLAGQDDAVSVAAEIAGSIGLADEPGAGAELFPAVRRLFETLAHDQPVAIVLDDLHWAQPTLLDLVEYLAEFVAAPLLIVGIGRPELLDARPAWAVDEGDAASFVLEPLSPLDSEKLVVDRLAGRLVPDAVVTQVLEMADGNPLFIEQLLAALRDEGQLRFPPSVHALLAERLDRLGPAERDVLRCASVIGPEFSREALTAIVPDRARPVLDRHLDALRRKQLIHLRRRPSVGAERFAFRHALVQEAAYRSTTRESRAHLHLACADWLDGAGEPDRDELAAHHLEQAHQHRRRLGLDDEATRTLAVRAGERLARCGLRAYNRFDMTVAENLLSRARALLPADHRERYDVLRRLAQAYPTLGRLSDAGAVLAEMLDDPRLPDDPRLAPRLRLEQLRIGVIAGPDPVSHDAIRVEVARALATVEPLEDHVGISQACYVLATLQQREGAIRAMEEVSRRGLDHARQSGDLRELLGALWFPSWALVDGPTAVPSAIGLCEELLALRADHPGVLTDLARLEAMRGRFDLARDLCARARRVVVERSRVRRALTVLELRRAQVEVLAGELDTAEPGLRAALEVALDVGERDLTSQIAAALARAVSARGDVDDAAHLAALARQQAPSGSVAAQAGWRVATAVALATRGDTAGAVRLARAAITLVPPDLLNLRADLHLDLAQALLASGQHERARSAAAEAGKLYDRKGNLVGASLARPFRDRPATQTEGRRRRG